MYTIITARVEDQALLLLSVPKIASGGANEVRVEVSFSTDWIGYGKTAIFYRNKNKVYNVVMTDDACTIPHEVLAEAGRVYFGILGASGATVRTTEVVALSISQGAITGVQALEPLPDVYQQVLSAYGHNAEAIAVERARIDNLVKLPNGSTTSDAELQDIRVGANGLTFATAGAAVREQLNSITPGRNRATGENTKEGYYVLYEDGTEGAHANYAYVSIAVRSGEKYYISDTSNVHTAFFSGELSPDNYISGHLNAEYVVAPAGAVLMTVSVTKAKLASLQVCTKLTQDSIFDGEITHEKLAPGVRAAAKKTVTVGPDGDYPTILGALIANQGDTRILVSAGTYNVADEYAAQYGTDYFTNYTGYAGSTNKLDAGLYLFGGCELIGVGEVNITFDYTGANENVRKFFSPLNTTQNNVVENINFSIGDDSCRYIIHDDFATEGGTNIFRNCTFAGSSHLTTSMGCGMGTANTYIIEGCTFTGNHGIDIAYHNNVAAGVNKVIVRDCSCTGAIRGAHYGTSKEKSKFIVSGCKASRVYLIHGDAANYPNTNIELIVDDITSHESRIDAMQRRVPIGYRIGEWQQGGIASNGNVNTSSSRIRTANFFPASSGSITCMIPEGLRLTVVYYDADKNHLSNSAWLTDRVATVKVFNGCAYVRLMAAYTASNTTPITPDAAELAGVAAHNDYALVKKPALKILIIGNSFNQDAVAYLPPVLNELLPDVDITYADCYTSSADIPKHIEMYESDTEITRYNLWTPGAYCWMRYASGGSNPRTLRQALAENVWDIILTNATTSDVYPEDVTSKVITPLRQLLRILQTDAPKPFQMMWFQVMGRDDDSKGAVVPAAEMYANHVAATKRVMDETGVLDYIPVGTALQNARTNATLQALGAGGNMLYSDNKHINAGLPALLATYTTALKIVEWYGRKTAGLYGSTFVPTAETVNAMNASDGSGGGMTHGEPVGVTDANIRAAQEIAVMAVKHPDKVTDCSGILLA